MNDPRQVSAVHVPLVLLVDDNVDTLEMYALGLQYEGLRVEKARNGEEAFHAIAAVIPDCIVADIRLPRVNGLDFKRILSGTPATAHIPVIALTSFAGPADMQAAKAAGFESVLVKPCLPEQVAREIARVVTVGRDRRTEAAAPNARALQALAKAARLRDRTDPVGRRHRAQSRPRPFADG